MGTGYFGSINRAWMMWPRGVEVVWVLIPLCVCDSAYRGGKAGWSWY